MAQYKCTCAVALISFGKLRDASRRTMLADAGVRGLCGVRGSWEVRGSHADREGEDEALVLAEARGGPNPLSHFCRNVKIPKICML